MIDQPFKLPCGAVLKNRIVKAALTERLAGANHLPNEKHRTLYQTWAESDASLLLSGNILIDKRYLESTGNVVIDKDTNPEQFKTWTHSVKKNRIHFWAQLNHAGRQSSIMSTFNPVSASDVKLKKMGFFAKPTPLSEEGIKDIIERFVYAARFCQEVGFSGVQFHSAHGYLISQFLSPITNRRSDQWGGSLEARARLLFEVIEQTRLEVGNKFPISVKLNSADFQRGGFTEDESLEVIKGLEQRGVDLLEISGGTYERSAMFGEQMKDSTLQREAYFLEFAKRVRKQCSLPLMVTGGFRSLAFSNAALENDHLDLVGFGRPFLLNELFPKEFLSGKLTRVEDPVIKVLDPKNSDVAEAGFYDYQISRLAAGKPISYKYSALQAATRVPFNEFKMGMRNWLFG